MNAQLRAPLACPPWNVSALQSSMSVFYLHGILADGLRSLRILRTGKHDHVRRRRLGHHSPLARRVADGGFLEESDSRLGNAASIAFSICGDSAKEVLGCFFG